MKHRDSPPGYLEYASSFLSNRDFRMMTLAERGLLMTARFEAWVNGSVPAANEELAQYLGISLSEIEVARTDRVERQFSIVGGEIRFADLDAYRDKLTELRAARQGGAAKTNAKKKAP